MCRIVGIINQSLGSELPRIIHTMTQCLAHGGPDFQETWVDQGSGVALGHYRLLI